MRGLYRLPHEPRGPTLGSHAGHAQELGGHEVTKVLHLGTSKHTTYSCPPEQAVVAAYEQSRGNNNTWTYPTFADHPEARRGQYSVSCGDFTALMQFEEVTMR